MQIPCQATYNWKGLYQILVAAAGQKLTSGEETQAREYSQHVNDGQ